MRIFKTLKITLTLLAALALSGCDILVGVDLNEDGAGSLSYTASFDAKACAQSEALMRKPVCGGTNANGDPFGSYDDETGLFWTTPKQGTLSDLSDVSQVSAESVISLDRAERVMSINFPVSELQNAANAGPPSAKRERVATEFKLGAPELWDGHSFSVVVNAKEILESNGTVNADATQVRFDIPMVYYVYGLGDPGIEHFSLKARY